jgi:putative hemolysin
MKDQKKFQRKIKIEFEDNKYLVKTLEFTEELERLLELRKRIFREVGYISDDRQLGSLDLVSDHLSVIDKRSENFIASYVLTSSKESNFFGCDKRWVFDEFKENGSEILELSWLCVDSKCSTSRIWLLYLLRGIVEYATISGEKYYFGSISIPSNNVKEISQIAYYFQKNGYVSEQFHIYPKEATNLLEISEENYWSDQIVENHIPKLFFWYFKSGVKLAKQPVILTHVERTDFFIYGETKFANDYYKAYKLNRWKSS